MEESEFMEIYFKFSVDEIGKNVCTIEDENASV